MEKKEGWKKTAHRLEPQLENHVGTVASCYFEMQRWDLSRQYYQRCFALSGRTYSTPLASIGRIERLLGHFQDAESYISRALEIKAG